jgi:hypothetical protein
MIDPVYEAQWADLNTMDRLRDVDKYCVPVVILLSQFLQYQLLQCHFLQYLGPAFLPIPLS